jgi:hypothetical protein
MPPRSTALHTAIFQLKPAVTQPSLALDRMLMPAS